MYDYIHVLSSHVGNLLRLLTIAHCSTYMYTMNDKFLKPTITPKVVAPLHNGSNTAGSIYVAMTDST